jgi:acetyl-CoA carboxylase alpha subunit
MKLAEKFRRPVIAFIDTPAAYPGIESEERGISEAIALNLREMAALDTPILVIVHGEGGSGGALGLAVGDRILMHEFAIYSVIPPEGCAAILWRDSGRKVEAADCAEAHGRRSAQAQAGGRDRPGTPWRRTHESRARGHAAGHGAGPRAGEYVQDDVRGAAPGAL